MASDDNKGYGVPMNPAREASLALKGATMITAEQKIHELVAEKEKWLTEATAIGAAKKCTDILLEQSEAECTSLRAAVSTQAGEIERYKEALANLVVEFDKAEAENARLVDVYKAAENLQILSHPTTRIEPWIIEHESGQALIWALAKFDTQKDKPHAG